MGNGQSSDTAQEERGTGRTDEQHESPYEKAFRLKEKSAVKKLIQERILPTQRDMQFAYASNLYFKDIEDMIDIARAHIQNQSSLIKRVCATYPPGTNNEIIFIAFTSTSDKINMSLPYTIVFRKLDDYSSEGATITYCKESLRKPFTKKESLMITKALEKHSKYLMDKHSNIQMISACSVKSKDFGTFGAKIIPTTCVVIYVDVKGLIPIGESPFPECLDNVPVDVREGGPRLLNKKAPDQFHEHLQMGCQLASDFGMGTLGAFLEKPNTSELYCLTCAHVVVKPDDFAKGHDGTVSFSSDYRKVYQPVPSALNQIGHVEKAVFKFGDSGHTGVDIALISVTKTTRGPLTGEFPSGDYHIAGFTEQRPMMYTSGEVYTRGTMPDQFESRSEVIKFGSSSGPTRGSFYLNGTSVRRRDVAGTVMNFGFELHNQMEVLSIDPSNTRAFAEPGDSGSLVFIPHNGKCSDLRAVGILEGGTFNNTYIVTPIWDVLNVLEMPLRLKTFPYLENQDIPLLSSFASMSLQSSPNQAAIESRIEILARDLLDDAERRDQAKSQEIAGQIAAINIHLNSEVEDLHHKIDGISDEIHVRISRTEGSNQQRHREVMDLLQHVFVKLDNLDNK